jgi:hypothetical protein
MERHTRTICSGHSVTSTQVVAHARVRFHKVYDQHAYLDEKRRALELWVARLRRIVEPAQDANVVSLALG